MKIIIIAFFLIISFKTYSETAECDLNFNDFNSNELNIDFFKNQKKCASNELYDSLPQKTLSIIFGDISSLATSYAQILTNETATANEIKDLNNLDELQTVIKSISLIFTILAISLVILQTLKILIVVQNGEFLQNKLSSTFTFLKMSLGISLIVPFFEGYSLSQFLMILAASLSNLISNTIWFILSFVLSSFIFEETKIEQLAATELNQEQIIESIQKNAIQMNICDLEKRYIFLERENNTKITSLSHKNNEFNKCIEKYKNLPVIAQKSIFKPAELILTDYCIDQVYKTTVQQCGYYETSDALKSIDFAAINSEARTIAQDIINLSCVDKNLLKKFGKPFLYGYTCAEISENGYNFSSNSITYVDFKQDKKKLKDDIFESQKNLNIIIKNKINETISNNLNEIDINDKIKEITAKSLQNGWFSASHFIFDATDSIVDINSKISDLYKFFSAAAVLVDKDLLNSDISTLYIDSINETQATFFEEKEGYLFGIKDFFVNLTELNNYSVAKEFDTNDCITNFSKCVKSSLNPLYFYIKSGDEMLSNTSKALVAVTAFYNLKKINSDNDIKQRVLNAFVNTLSISKLFLKILFIVALLVVYVTPLIPFFFFFGRIVSFIILIIESVVTAQIWALQHLTTTKTQSFTSEAMTGYKLILSILIHPAILTLSVALSFVATSIGIAIFNVLFSVIINVLSFEQNSSSILQFVFTSVFYITYIVLLIIVIYRINKMIFSISDTLIEQINLFKLSNDESWNEIINQTRKIIEFDFVKHLKM